MANFSIFGGHGFVGRHLATLLGASGHAVRVIGRDFPPHGETLGHAVYAIGLTANFRARLSDAMRAHVCVLADVLERYRFKSFLYLSSTRVYADATSTLESASLSARPEFADHVYNLSKMAGEALCLSQPQGEYRVARLSNVIGRGAAPDNFLPSLLDEVHRTGKLVIRTSAQSSKDYIDVADACMLLAHIAAGGQKRIYNVASGVNTTNQAIADAIGAKLAAPFAFAPDAPTVSFPPIDVGRISNEFKFLPRPFAVSLSSLIESSEFLK